MINRNSSPDSARRPGWRETIWSVPGSFVFAYFALVTTLGLPAVVVIVWREAANGVDAAGWWLWPTALTIEAAPLCGAVGIGIAFSALVTVQGAACLMVLYQYAVNRWVKPVINRNVEAGRAEGRVEGISEGRAEGITEGRTEADQEWAGWLARKEAAESRGLPFDEPPPNARR